MANFATVPAEDWQAPTADEIKEVLELIRQRKGLSKPLSGVDVADLVGLPGERGSGKGTRTFRRWVSKTNPSPIAYGAWSILAHLAGFGAIWDADRD
ncbi:transcriptional repressor protein KorC (plasmid) [Klebsiella pneumoniae]|uniref:transcriptional repressor protein KorC n=1 Tax=Klebsiella pneumoniae TaxID=573 RepID=UPI003747BFE5